MHLQAGGVAVRPETIRRRPLEGDASPLLVHWSQDFQGLPVKNSVLHEERPTVLAAENDVDLLLRLGGGKACVEDVPQLLDELLRRPSETPAAERRRVGQGRRTQGVRVINHNIVNRRVHFTNSLSPCLDHRAASAQRQARGLDDAPILCEIGSHGRHNRGLRVSIVTFGAVFNAGHLIEPPLDQRPPSRRAGTEAERPRPRAPFALEEAVALGHPTRGRGGESSGDQQNQQEGEGGRRAELGERRWEEPPPPEALQAAAGPHWVKNMD